MRTLKIIWDLHAKQRGWTYRRTGWWIVKCTVVCISLLRNHLWNVARLEVPFFAFFSLVFSNIRINCLFLRLLIFVSSGSEGLQYHMCFYFLCQGHIRENATKDAWLLISFLFGFFFLHLYFKWVPASTVYIQVKGQNQNTHKNKDFWVKRTKNKNRSLDSKKANKSINVISVEKYRSTVHEFSCRKNKVVQ